MEETPGGLTPFASPSEEPPPPPPEETIVYRTLPPPRPALAVADRLTYGVIGLAVLTLVAFTVMLLMLALRSGAPPPPATAVTPTAVVTPPPAALARRAERDRQFEEDLRRRREEGDAARQQKLLAEADAVLDAGYRGGIVEYSGVAGRALTAVGTLCVQIGGEPLLLHDDQTVLKLAAGLAQMKMAAKGFRSLTPPHAHRGTHQEVLAMADDLDAAADTVAGGIDDARAGRTAEASSAMEAGSEYMTSLTERALRISAQLQNSGG